MAWTVDDESFATTDPAYDAPPRFRDADERRLHARAYNLWATLQRGRAFPSPADLDLTELGGFAPNSVLLAITLGGGASADGGAELRFLGPRLREQAGLGESVPADALPPGSLAARLVARVPEVLAARAPVGFADEYATSRGSELLCRGILMPLSSDGETIDMIHGVVNWKQVVAPELARQLAAEIGDLVRVTRSAGVGIDPFG